MACSVARRAQDDLWGRENWRKAAASQAATTITDSPNTAVSSLSSPASSDDPQPRRRAGMRTGAPVSATRAWRHGDGTMKDTHLKAVVEAETGDRQTAMVPSPLERRESERDCERDKRCERCASAYATRGHLLVWTGGWVRLRQRCLCRSLALTPPHHHARSHLLDTVSLLLETHRRTSAGTRLQRTAKAKRKRKKKRKILPL